MKAAAERIFRQTLAAIDIPSTMERKLARSDSRICCDNSWIDLRAFREIRVIAFGKAAAAMTGGLVSLLEPDFSATGIMVAPTPAKQAGFETFVAGHPLPTGESLAAARAILDLLAGCNEHTLVFFLLSGGGSALVELPLDARVSLEDVKSLHRALVTCGAPIDEINAVRKHLSAVKGGRLAAAAPQATKITLGVSDVPPGRESALASGPTIPDPTTIDDAYHVVERYSLLPKLPQPIREHFERRTLVETPKAGDPAFRNAHFQILLDVHDLFHHAHQAAEAEGFITICDNCTDDWPLERAAAYLLALLAKHKSNYPTRRVAVLADGEIQCPVTGDGVGGRNTAFALHCANKIANQPVVVLSAGTDGVDGSSPAAGAVSDGTTVSRARSRGLDPEEYFRRSDSHSFFHKLDDAIVTGPTGNNLRDLRILLAP